MTDESKKITELTETTTPVGADLLAIVTDVSGTPLTQKVLFSNISSTISTDTINNIVGGDVTIVDQVLTISSGVLNIDYDLGQSMFLDITENVTSVTFSNIPASGLSEFEIEILQDAAVAYTITFPAAAQFVGGTEPDFSTLSSTHLVHWRTRNAGTKWLLTHAAEFS